MTPFRLVALLLVLLIQSPVVVQDNQAARSRLKEMNVPFTADALIQSIIEGDKPMVELFLAAGMSPNTALVKQLEVGNRVHLKGQTALMLALCYEYNDIASTLLANGADLNQKGDNETFPLQLAKGAMVKELIERGADVNQRGSYGETALMWAAEGGDLEKLALLLEHGADINAKDQGGFTALRFAAKARLLQVVKLLIGHGADLSGFSERAIRLMTSDPQQGDRVTQLIHKLDPTGDAFSRTGPSIEVRHEVLARLLEVAGESAGARAQVIERLLDVVEDPAAQDESPIADEWMTAVKVLGKLRATEALDVLVDNLDRTGQNGELISIHIKPVYSALVAMGEPAVPKLIEALSHPNRAVRMEAAWVLFSINKGQAKTALELSCQNEKDEEVRQAFRSVIKRIEEGY